MSVWHCYVILLMYGIYNRSQWYLFNSMGLVVKIVNSISMLNLWEICDALVENFLTQAATLIRFGKSHVSIKFPLGAMMHQIWHNVRSIRFLRVFFAPCRQKTPIAHQSRMILMCLGQKLQD